MFLSVTFLSCVLFGTTIMPCHVDGVAYTLTYFALCEESGQHLNNEQCTAISSIICLRILLSPPVISHCISDNRCGTFYNRDHRQSTAGDALILERMGRLVPMFHDVRIRDEEKNESLSNTDVRQLRGLRQRNLYDTYLSTIDIYPATYADAR